MSLQIPPFFYFYYLNGVCVSGFFSNIFKKTEDSDRKIPATASLSGEGESIVLRICGDWLLKNVRTPFEKIGGELSSHRHASSIKVDAEHLGEYDSALVAFLLQVYELCGDLDINFDMKSVPEGPKALLKLATAVPEAGEASKKSEARRSGLFGKVGSRAIGVFSSFNSISGFVGETVIAVALALSVARASG